MTLNIDFDRDDPLTQEQFNQFFNNPEIQELQSYIKASNQMFACVQLIIDYEHNKNVAITTGVFAIAALVAAVAICILFPPTILAWAGLALAGAATLAFTITSAVHIDRARKGNELFNNQELVFNKLD